MKTFLSLLKVDLLRLFGINKAIKSGKGGGRIVAIAIGAVFIGLFVIVESAALTLSFAAMLPSGEKYKALAVSICLYIIVVLFLTVGTSRIMFGCTDYDLLMSLPIKPSAVVLSKITYVYIVDFLFAVAFIVPSGIICGIAENAVLVYSLCSVLYCFFIPLVPMAVGLGIGTLVSFIVSKIQNKTLVGVVGSALFIALYLLFLFGNNESEGSWLFSFFSNASFAPVWFIASGIAGKPTGLLATVFGSLVVGMLTVWAISANYKRINQSIAAKVGGKKFVMQGQTQSSVKKTLLRREFKLFFSSSTNIMNSLIGPVVVIALSIMFLVNGGASAMFEGEGELNPDEVANSLKLISDILISALPFFTVMLISVNTYASYAFSLEGKRLWVLKSLPIAVKDIIGVKMFVSIVLSAPFAVIATVIAGIGLNASAFDIVFSCVIVVAYCVCDIAIGLLVNFKYNFFNWVNEAEVVKRGASVMICMLIGMLGALVMGGVQIVATLFVSRYLGWIILLVLLAGLSVLFIKLLLTDCEQKFRRLGE